MQKLKALGVCPTSNLMNTMHCLCFSFVKVTIHLFPETHKLHIITKKL